MGSLYENLCCWAWARPWSTSVRASAVRPETAAATWQSISEIFSMLAGSRSGEVTRFSTARTTPSAVLTPMAVEPS
jgi:hypothetical protein